MSAGKGGWQPVVYGRGMSAGKGKLTNTRGDEIYTVFVDNIPWSMSPKDLHSLFGKFGVVRDVFIPNKTRKATKSRFGFVRYGCSVAASVAIQKANGLWCDDKALKVKTTEFERKAPAVGRGTEGARRLKNLIDRTTVTKHTRRSELVDIGVKSYADAVQGGQCREVVKHEIIVTEAGNGWLYDSLIVKLRSYHVFSEFRMAVLAKGSGEVIVRKGGGGRQAIVSFSSRAHLEENQLLLQDCWKEWCESVAEWKKGDYIEQEREVWICCYGVPFNLWSADNFMKIGRIWGEVLKVDDETVQLSSFSCGRVKIATKFMESINSSILVLSGDRRYPVRVCEEQVMVTKVVQEDCKCAIHDCHSSNKLEQMDGEHGTCDEEDDAEVAGDESHEGAVEDEVADDQRHEVSFSGANVSGGQKVDSFPSIVVESASKCGGNTKVAEIHEKHAEEDGMLAMQSVKGSSVDDEVEKVLTPGYMNSLSGDAVNRPGINLEVVLNKAPLSLVLSKSINNQVNMGLSKPNNISVGLGQSLVSCSVDQAHDRIYSKVAGAKSGELLLKKGSKSNRIQSQIRALGDAGSGKEKRGGSARQKQQGVSRGGGSSSKANWHKGPAFRVAAAVLSRQKPPGQVSAMSNVLIAEALETVRMGKALGIDFLGKEEEVVRKIVELEEEDARKAAQVAVGD